MEIPYIYNNTNTKLDWDSIWNALFWLKWRTKNQKTTVSPNQLHSNSSSKKFFFPRKKSALGDRILQFICLLLFLITSRFHLRYVSWRRENNRNYFFLGLLFICFFKKKILFSIALIFLNFNFWNFEYLFIYYHIPNYFSKTRFLKNVSLSWKY